MKDKVPMEDELEIVDPREAIELDDVDTSSKGSSQDAGSDYELIRSKILTAVVRGGEALDEAVKMMKAIPSPKMLESVAKTISSIADSSEKLLIIHEKIRELNIEQSVDVEAKKGQHKLADIIKLVKDQKNGTEG